MYFIDSSMGVAGDMLVGAFIDLDILDREKVRRILEKAGNEMGPTTVELVHHDIQGIEGGSHGVEYQASRIFSCFWPEDAEVHEQGC